MSKPQKMKVKTNLLILDVCKVFSNENDTLRLYIYDNGAIYLSEYKKKCYYSLKLITIYKNLYEFPHE